MQSRHVHYQQLRSHFGGDSEGNVIILSAKCTLFCTSVSIGYCVIATLED